MSVGASVKNPPLKPKTKATEKRAVIAAAQRQRVAEERMKYVGTEGCRERPGKKREWQE